MTRSELRIFGARMDGLQQALGFVQDFCAQHAVDPGDVLRLTLVVEELFTNVVTHGHRGEVDAPVRLQLGVSANQVALRFEDSAPAFDPLRYLADAAPRLDTQVEERQVGGLGLPLVAEMAERFDYAHVDGFNCVQLVLSRSA